MEGKGGRTKEERQKSECQKSEVRRQGSLYNQVSLWRGAAESGWPNVVHSRWLILSGARVASSPLRYVA